MNGKLDPQTAFLKTAPLQYVNCTSILEKSGDYIRVWGKKALICGGKRALEASRKQLTHSLKSAGISWEEHIFTGECCDENIECVVEKLKQCKADVLIGAGGGKCLDTAKAAAGACTIPVVCIPTIAATCSATTAQSVVYSKTGIFERVIFLSSNPQLALVDPDIIAGAPVQYLQAGILDSLAKWFEGRTVFKGIKTPDIYTSSAMCLSKLLYDEMKKKAVQAIESVKENRVSDPLIHVIDLVVYLTGVIQGMGHETLRGGVAHAVHNGLTLIEESHALLHGIKVGYGIMVQLVLEKVSQKELREVLHFFRKLDFEPSLKGLNLVINRDDALKIAEKAAGDPYVGKMPYPVEPEMILWAIEKLENVIDKL